MDLVYGEDNADCQSQVPRLGADVMKITCFKWKLPGAVKRSVDQMNSAEYLKTAEVHWSILRTGVYSVNIAWRYAFPMSPVFAFIYSLNITND